MNMNTCATQAMTYHEREELKFFAYRCAASGDIQSLERTLIMIAHWMRQGQRIPFTEYASQWSEAQKNREDGNHSTPAMVKLWPFSGKRCIRPAGSDYYPHGCDRERQDDETEINHAITLIFADYPQFNHNGLALYKRDSIWHHPLDYVNFMKEAKSCMEWLRTNNLVDCKIKTFPADSVTSYTLKHHIEQVNGKNCHENGKPKAPNYITNGALIAAMVASGYRIKPSGRMNCTFNISNKKLTNVMKKDRKKQA